VIKFYFKKRKKVGIQRHEAGAAVFSGRHVETGADVRKNGQKAFGVFFCV
jgi:hypothetical protein